MFRLDDKVAVVIGGGGSIGGAVALGLAQQGARAGPGITPARAPDRSTTIDLRCCLMQTKAGVGKLLAPSPEPCLP
jgi:NAD(P)-dependent dehydrogenase (short-subunit alcohol dehydrogenase family)